MTSKWLICNFCLSFVIFLILMTKDRQTWNFNNKNQIKVGNSLMWISIWVHKQSARSAINGKCWAQRIIILRVFALKNVLLGAEHVVNPAEFQCRTSNTIHENGKNICWWNLGKIAKESNPSQIKWKGLLTTCRTTVLKIILILLLTTRWVCCVIGGRASVRTWCGATPAKPVKIIIIRHIEPSTHASLKVTITWRWACIIQ